MKPIKQNYLMNASPKKVFEALTKPSVIKFWSGTNGKMSARKGSTFSLWGGDCHGKNLEVIKNKKLVQEWYYGKGRNCWEKPSFVTFTIKPKGKNSIVTLLHKGVPADQHKSIDQGWDLYYLGSMKRMFEGLPV